ncbi:MAG TPA: DUF502 domain-containing protein [Tepidisphaeraceae bacterium]|jgi:uncharacterized membrane protein
MPDALPDIARPRQRSRRFFVRGLKTLLPTLITLYLIVWVWEFLWENVGRHLIWLLQNLQYQLAGDEAQWGAIRRTWTNERGDWQWWAQLVGVALAVLIVYLVGLLVGNLIGRTFWRLGESLVLRIPVVRAIYPAAKQITDFVLYEKSAATSNSRVVACRPHANGVWSIGLVTGPGMKSLEQISGEELVTVFVPSSPTAFSGYVLVVPRSQLVELPMKVEEAMRILISGGVLTPAEAAGASSGRAGRV